MQPRLDPLNDYLFYKVMGEKNDEVQLLGFINAVLGKTGDDMFTAVEILENKTFTPENIGDKSTTLDVRAVFHGKTKVNAEVQLRNQNNMDKRSLFHWSREFSRSLNAGHDYRELPNVIAVNIIDFDYLGTKGFHSCFQLRDSKEHDIILTEALEIHFINMVRYRKLKGKGILENPLFRWLAWFDRGSRPELLKEVLKMDAAIFAAEERLAYISGDEDAMDMYRRRLMASCDRTSELNYARDQGHAEGHAERGEEERNKAIQRARTAKAEGVTTQTIQMLTGLDIETIKNL